MRFRDLALASLLLATAAAPARADVFVYGCVLNPRQEAPIPVSSSAFGGGTFIIDTGAKTMTFRIAFTGLSAAETAAHIHGPGDPGVSAGVLFPLPLGNPKVGVWNYPAASEADILAGKMYANIHSGTFPGGEIRGQIVPMNAFIDGLQETPPTTSSATGWGVFTVDKTLHQLGYYIVVEGLSAPETAAHIHGYVLHGTPAGVVNPLPLGSPKVGVWNYPVANEQDILAGRTYVNVHTTAFPGGEIRGQVGPTVVPMDAQQEVPPNAVTAAAGVGLVAMDVGADQLSFDIRVAGLSGAETAAHIHGYAPPGMNAPVLFPLPLGGRKIGVWAYPGSNEPDILNGLTYVNSHTGANPGGEIRGQINSPGALAFTGVGDRPITGTTLRAAPNPFNSYTTMSFLLAREGPVSLSIVGVDGRLVRRFGARSFTAGTHTLDWNGRDERGRQVSSGIYFAVLSTPEGQRVARMARVR